jgi:pimeloyl-ACP methyl ester carboxylesterase
LVSILRVIGIPVALLSAFVMSFFVIGTLTSTTGRVSLGAVAGLLTFVFLWGGALWVGLPGRPGLNRNGAVFALGLSIWIYPFGSALFVPSPVLPVLEVSHGAAKRSTLVLSRGERMNVWSIEAKHTEEKGVVLFVPGGPGGRVSSRTLSFLEAFADDGYDVFAYDHYSAGYSQYEDADPSLLTIDDEVRRLAEIAGQVGGGDPVHLLGHSYAGVVISRFLARYPHDASSFVAFDTSPLYSLTGGNLKGRKVLDETLLPRASSRGKQGTSITVSGGAADLSLLFTGHPPHVGLRRLLVLFWHDGQNTPRVGSAGELGTASALLEQSLSATTATGSLPKTVDGSSEIAQRINADIRASPAFHDELIAAQTPKVLVFHPEKGLVGWHFHRDYASFFDEVSFVPVPGAGHTVWRGNEKFVVETSIAFFEDRLDRALVYDGVGDPFSEAPSD